MINAALALALLLGSYCGRAPLVVHAQAQNAEDNIAPGGTVTSSKLQIHVSAFFLYLLLPLYLV